MSEFRGSAGLRYIAVALAGAVLPLSMAPMSWWPVAIFSCAALFRLTRGQRGRQLFLTNLVFGISLYATGASWIYVSIHHYGQASVPLAGLMTAAFAVGLGLVFALPMQLLGLTQPRTGLANAGYFAAIWVLGEWFRGWFLTGFPWLYLGYGQIDTWLAGWLPILGVLGVSFAIALSGALCSQILAGALGTKVAAATDSAITLTLIALLWLSGYVLKPLTWTTPTSTQALRVSLVQPDNPVLGKWQAEVRQRILADFHGLLAKKPDQDLIVWPESAIPALQHEVGDFLDQMARLAEQHNTGLIAGIPEYRLADQRYFNSVIALGTATGHYQKRRLVPFGEYVPLERWLRGLISFFDLPMSAFSSGADQQALIAVGPHRIATAICYEIAYARPLARDARAADILLTVSNDTWFGSSFGPHQHLQIARVRALENQKPLLRSTNDGITAFINARGEIETQLSRFIPGVLDGVVVPRHGLTPFARWQDTPILALCLVIAISAGLRARRPRKQPGLPK